MYEIVFSRGVADDLKRLRAYDRNRILDQIENQLVRAPNRETRHKNVLEDLVPPFEAVPPVWQLRVGDFRVFYDVDEQDRTVSVRAVRRKPPHKETEDIV